MSTENDSFTLAQVASLRAADTARILELEEMLENAAIAAADTSPSWKHRCYSIMGALGFDYGDPDWLMPGERRRLDAALARISELEDMLAERSLPLEEIERLLDVEQSLERHHVGYDGSFPPLVWYVRSNDTPTVPGRVLSSHPTRWAALSSAEVADRPPEDSTALRNA